MHERATDLGVGRRDMKTPIKTIGGELAPDEGHEKFAEMAPPFTSVNREGDYREAWKYFEGLKAQ